MGIIRIPAVLTSKADFPFADWAPTLAADGPAAMPAAARPFAIRKSRRFINVLG
jgi:hypothetical protein